MHHSAQTRSQDCGRFACYSSLRLQMLVKEPKKKVSAARPRRAIQRHHTRCGPRCPRLANIAKSATSAARSRLTRSPRRVSLRLGSQCGPRRSEYPPAQVPPAMLPSRALIVAVLSLLCAASSAAKQASAAVPDGFPRFVVPGWDKEMDSLRRLFWLHYQPAGPLIPLGDLEARQDATWTTTSGRGPLRSPFPSGPRCRMAAACWGFRITT